MWSTRHTAKKCSLTFEQAFEAAYPTVDVVWLDMGSQSIFDRIQTERENPQADVWWGGPKELFVLADSLGLLEPYTPSWASALSPEYKSPRHTWHATHRTAEGIMYNTELLSPDAVPKEWDDLLDRRWQRQIIIRDPVQSGTMQTIFAAMIEKERVRTGSVDSGFAWLEKLHANTKSYAADPTQLFLKLARGEALLTLWNLNDALLQSRLNRFPFGFILPESGTVFAIEGIAIVKGAKHLENAKRFYEFVTSPESLHIQAERFYRIPARSDLKLNVDWLKGLSLKPLLSQTDYLERHQRAWLKRWQEEIRPKSLE
ncbi:MAG: extracellular solute-binding protein [Chloroherpetonaceae bacterium]|nr:extracellular solute-binding protein [Chloroherpetonaceae bacterium]